MVTRLNKYQRSFLSLSLDNLNLNLPLDFSIPGLVERAVFQSLKL